MIDDIIAFIDLPFVKSIFWGILGALSFASLAYRNKSINKLLMREEFGTASTELLKIYSNDNANYRDELNSLNALLENSKKLLIEQDVIINELNNKIQNLSNHIKIQEQIIQKQQEKIKEYINNSKKGS